MKAKRIQKVLSFIMATAMLTSAMTIGTAAQETNLVTLNEYTPQTVSEEAQALPEKSEIVDVYSFDEDTEGFTTTDPTVLVSSNSAIKKVGEGSLLIDTTGAANGRFGVEKMFAEPLSGKKVSMWIYRADWDSVNVMRLDSGVRDTDPQGEIDYSDTMLFGLFSGSSSSQSRIRALAQGWNGSKLEYLNPEPTATMVTANGWYQLTIDMTKAGEVKYYIDNTLVRTVDLPDGVYGDFKKVSLLNSWLSTAESKTYVDELVISEPVPVPSNPVLDTEADTFDWTYATGKESPTDYEYSLDGGETWSDVVQKPLYVGNNAYELGDIKVRVKIPVEDGYVAPSITNSSTQGFEENINLTMEREYDILNFNVTENIVDATVSKDPATVSPDMSITTEQSHSGLSSMLMIPDPVNNAPDSGHITTKQGLFRVGSSSDTMIENKVLTMWVYDDLSVTSSNYKFLGITTGFDDEGTKISDSMVGFNNAASKTEYVVRSMPGETTDWSTWGKTGVQRTTGWHQFQWDYATVPGECTVYIDGQAVRTYASNGFNNYYMQDTWSHGTDKAAFEFYIDDISLVDSMAEVPVYPNAPTNPVNDDTNDTFDFTFAEGYDAVEDYEYSTDGGVSFQDVTVKPIPVGDFTFEAGEVIVRVKADAEGNTGALAGVVLRNSQGFISTYFEHYDEMQATIEFAQGFFKNDYPDEAKWNTFTAALEVAKTIAGDSSKEVLTEAKTNLDNAIADLATIQDIKYELYNYELVEGDEELYPFVATVGTLTSGEALSPHGDYLKEYYGDKMGAELSTEYVNGSHQAKAIYTFAAPMEDYIVDIPWEVTYSPVGTTELWLLDKEGENGVGIRSRKSTAWFEFLTMEDGKVTTINANIRMSTNCINAMRFDFANVETGGLFTIDGRPVLSMVNGVEVFQNHFDLDNFQQIVFTSVNDVEEDFVFDNVFLAKHNPAVSVEIADEEIELGYYETYVMPDVLLDITAEDTSYPSTDIISYSVIEGDEYIDVTPDGNIEPFVFGTGVVEAKATSGAKDTITVNYVDRKTESLMITTSPLFDIHAMDEPSQLLNNSLPVVPATNIELNLGEGVVLNGVTTPTGTTTRLFNWKSSDENVVNVTDGLVTAVNYGTATVTATAQDGTGVSTSCTITVKEDDHVFGKEIYVATDGDDVNGDGSMANPYATVQKARDVVAEMELPEGGVVVYFREGIYTISETIEFTAENSGEAGKPIEYAAYPGEEVSFDGAVNVPVTDMELVTATDEIYSRLHADGVGEVYSVNVSDLGITNKNLQVVGHSGTSMAASEKYPHMNFDESYYSVSFDGAPLTLARFPNDGTKPDPNGHTGMLKGTRVVDGGVSGRNWETDGILGGWGYEYNPGDEFDTFTIESQGLLTADKLATWAEALDPDLDHTDFGGQGAWMNGYWGADFSTQNVPIQAISGNDIVSGLISYYNPSTSVMLFYVYNLLEELDIPGEWYIDQISDVNEITLYVYPPEGTDMSDSSQMFSIPTLDEVMIDINGANYITFDGIDMKNANSGIINITGGSYNSVENAEISGVGGTLSTIKNADDGTLATFNGFNMCDIKHIDGGIELLGGDTMNLERGYNYVKNTNIYDFAMQNRSYNPAVNLGGVGNIVSNCNLWEAPHYAIYYNGVESLMEFCEIYDVIQEADDQGAIYTGRDIIGRGSIVRNCYIHGIAGEGVDKNNSIYLDDNKAGQYILDNVLENSTLGIKSGGQANVIIGNLIVNQESGITVDPGGMISTGYTWQHGYNAICSPGDYEDMTLEPWDDPDSAYGRFDTLYFYFDDEPLNTNKHKVIIDNQFINVIRDEDPRATDYIYGVDIWGVYDQQAPFEYMMEEYIYGETFTKNNNGLDRPEDGLAANPSVFDSSYEIYYSTTVSVNSGEGEVFGTKSGMIKDVTQKITATPAKGYEFVNWVDASGNVVSTNPIYIFTVDSNEVFKANFAEESVVEPTYEVTVTDGTGSGSYEEGTIVNITADTAETGMEFDKWVGNVTFADETSMTTSFEMPAEEVSITATYKAKELPPVDTDSTIIIETEKAQAGDEVMVDITLENNPGITSMKLVVDYDEDMLELVGVTFNKEFGEMTSAFETADANSVLILNWVDGTKDFDTADMTYATLKFKVKDTATAGDLSITATYDQVNVFNLNGENVAFDITDGKVEVVEVVMGDTNSDGFINNKDVMALLQYTSNMGADIDMMASDINDDGVIDNRDVMMLFDIVSKT